MVCTHAIVQLNFCVRNNEISSNLYSFYYRKRAKKNKNWKIGYLLVIRLFDNFDIQVLCQINYNWAHLVLLDIISAWFRTDIVEYSAKYALKLARNSYYYFEINRVHLNCLVVR